MPTASRTSQYFQFGPVEGVARGAFQFAVPMGSQVTESVP